MTQRPVHGSLTGKAVTFTTPGGYEVIQVVQRTVREPRSGEVRIRVRAAAVNPTDLGLRERGVPGQDWVLVPGMDAAGTIESVGPDVSRLRAGEQVMAAVMPRRIEGGAQSEYIVVPAASVVPVPAGVSLAQAATLPMNGLTALRALELAGLMRGQVLGVSGGAGHLARCAIAVAKRQGLRVIADAKSSEFDLVRSYGADVIVERNADFAGAVRRQVSDGVDALLDTALLAERAFGAIRDGGVYVPVRGWSGGPGERGIRIIPVFVSQALERTEWLELLRTMVASGEIKLCVTGEYEPEQAAEAQRALEAGGLRGRPVIMF
jgi:NADPH:quinone reductase-like Zn-dependent oxidoreductase